jgi:hypothetical protein
MCDLLLGWRNAYGQLGLQETWRIEQIESWQGRSRAVKLKLIDGCTKQLQPALEIRVLASELLHTVNRLRS